MGTCFIFVKYWREETCLCLLLNQAGEVEAPLAERPFAEIKQLQHNANTVVVLSTEQASLHHVALPLLSEKKARLAIPFAIEEELASPVEELHFAFDRKHYHQGHYLVVVCQQSLLVSLLARLKAQHLAFDSITIDWWALKNNEVAVMDGYVLFHNPLGFSGAIPQPLADPYLEDLLPDQTLINFADNPALAANEWAAKRLFSDPGMNLCQGSLSQGSSHSKMKTWYGLALGLGLLCLLVFILTQVLTLYRIHSKTSQVDEEIAKIYRHFFPKATQVISPKFRIEQLLKSQGTDEDKTFWSLLNQFSLGLKQHPAEIESLQFQNKILKIRVLGNNFESLEALQTALKKAGVQVKQAEASSKGDKVSSSLELKL